ncbi:MAG: nucleoside monophosphate kinase, partial [Candidatus Saccharimonadales bacterium]
HGQLHATAVVHLEASQTSVSKRLLGRGRQDDTEEAIAARFAEYEQAVLPILEHFKAAGVPVVNSVAEQPAAAVHADIVKALKSLA